MGRGDPVPPVIVSRGKQLGRGENSLSDLLDASFGVSTNYILARGPGGWYAAPTINRILTFTWGLGVTVGSVANSIMVGTNPANIYLIASEAGTFNRVDMIAGTGPVGAAIIVDILKSTNQGSSFTSIFSTKPQINDGALAGGTNAVFNTTINQTDLLRLDVSQVGFSTAGNNVTVVLEVYA